MEDAREGGCDKELMKAAMPETMTSRLERKRDELLGKLDRVDAALKLLHDKPELEEAHQTIQSARGF
jgi:hypothetical protein